MALIAGTFVLVSGAVYYAFMAAWLNLFLIIGLSTILRLTLGEPFDCRRHIAQLVILRGSQNRDFRCNRQFGRIRVLGFWDEGIHGIILSMIIQRFRLPSSSHKDLPGNDPGSLPIEPGS